MKTIICLAASLFLASATLASSETITAGWLVSRLATARQLDAASPQRAVSALASVGVRIPDDVRLDRGLTEADVVRIASAFGVQLTTQRPTASFTRAQADAFVSAFGSDLAGTRGPKTGTNDTGGVPNPNSDNGKGKKKGHNRSSSEPLAAPFGS